MKKYQKKVPHSNGTWCSEMKLAFDSDWNI